MYNDMLHCTLYGTITCYTERSYILTCHYVLALKTAGIRLEISAVGLCLKNLASQLEYSSPSQVEAGVSEGHP